MQGGGYNENYFKHECVCRWITERFSRPHNTRNGFRPAARTKPKALSRFQRLTTPLKRVVFTADIRGNCGKSARYAVEWNHWHETNRRTIDRNSILYELLLLPFLQFRFEIPLWNLILNPQMSDSCLSLEEKSEMTEVVMLESALFRGPTNQDQILYKYD